MDDILNIHVKGLYLRLYKVFRCSEVQSCDYPPIHFVSDRNKSGHSCTVCMSPYSDLWLGYLGYRL